VFTVADGRGRVVWSGPRVLAIELSPDGKRLAIGAADGSALLLELATGARTPIRGHRGEVTAVRFSPDGARLASTSKDGTVRLWDAATGQPVWRTSALLLLPAPVAVTHRGVFDPTASLARLPAAVATLLASDTLASDGADDGATLCVHRRDASVEVWDLASGRRLAGVALAGVDDLRGARDGCLSLSEGVVRLHQRDGSVRELARDAVAFGRSADELLIATASDAFAIDIKSPSVRRDLRPTGRSVTAIGRIHGALLVGYRDGTVESDLVRFERTPSSPVVHFAAGPAGLVAVGFADGTLGLFRLDDGHPLGGVHLHGPVTRAVSRGDALFIASELGHHATLDLTPLRQPYCTLLDDVWQKTPLQWEAGKAVPRPPPRLHPCRR
jgi:WD40 repeat protein